MSAIRGHAGFGQNRAKIIATLGPASENHDTLVAMVRAGVNVIRLNMSHGTHEAHRKRIELVRSVSAEMNTPLAILGDLQGPKIRTGTLKDHKPIPLEEGAEVILTTAQHEGSEGIITTNYKELPMMVDVGSTILMDDTCGWKWWRNWTTRTCAAVWCRAAC
jgi:pyruvate kinase